MGRLGELADGWMDGGRMDDECDILLILGGCLEPFKSRAR